MTFLIVLLLTGSLGTPKSAFSGGGCVLSANNGEVWLKVYQEKGESEKGDPIWNGHLDKGDTHTLDAPSNDRIRYDYKTDLNDDYHGNVGATCADGNTLSVP
jgi:hypothetical protein